MRKGLFAICLTLVVLVALITALVPSCTPTPTTGTIVVQATLCGTTLWQGAVNYTLTPTGGSPVSGTGVPTTHSNMTATTWTCAYVAGGPGGAYFLNSIKPSASQSLVAGGTITFTLDFELKQDAAIQWVMWTLNGDEFQGNSTGELGPCNVTDVHFLQWVKGCTGYNVTLNETDWLQVIASPANPGPVSFYVVNADCALNKTPPPQGLPPVKKSQVPSINNATHEVGDNLTLHPGMTGMLDVHTVWQLVKGTNYTKNINWLGISKAPFEPMPLRHPCVLFELVVPPAPVVYSFQLIPSAHVDLVGATDVNMTNNDAMGPPLILNVFVGP